MHDKCPNCKDNGSFDPGKVRILELKFKFEQEPQVTITLNDWNHLILDWLRMKELLNEDVETRPKGDKVDDVDFWRFDSED